MTYVIRFFLHEINHKAFEDFYTNSKRNFDLFINENIPDGTDTAKYKVKIIYLEHCPVNNIGKY